MPSLKINEIEEGMINFSIIARVLKSEEIDGKRFKIVLNDGTGTVMFLSREKYTAGKILRIERAYAYSYKGKLTISITKKGKVTELDNREFFNKT